MEVALIVGWWTVFAPFAVSQLYVVHGVEGLAIGFLDIYLWAAVSLVALALARRLPLEYGRWRTGVPVHLAVGLVIVVLRQGLDVAITGWVAPRSEPFSLLLFAARLPSYLLRYLMLVGVAYGIEYFRRYRARELSAARLESQLARAQLQMLRVQLDPHFLFNTLHAISTLVRREPDAAERMIAHLSELLRTALAHQQAQEVTLEEEMEMLAPYLEIEKTRLGERLTVRTSLDPGTLDARFPHLVLQPLVENAIRHGIAPRRSGGTVEITSERRDGRLVVRIRDDGRGFTAEHPAGLGLANTRARLAQLYGEEQRFEVTSTPGRGTLVEIVVPLLPAAEPTPDLVILS